MISSVQLTGENYGEWATEMLNALKAKRKTGFVDGSVKKPTVPGSEMETWTSVNSMVVGWLRTSIVPRVRSTVSFISDATELWESLRRRFSVGNKVRIHQIVSLIASCRQEGQSVIDYYGRLVVLWDELQSYRVIPVCTCGAGAQIAKEREDEKVHQFVMGLDESRFGNVICQIVDADPMPDLAQAYAKAIREEQRLATVKKKEQQHEAIGFNTRSMHHVETSANHEISDASGFVTRSVSQGNNRNRDRVVCSHCGRTGHEKNFCWEVNGYPDWWVERAGKGRGSGRGGRGSNGMSGGRGKSYATVAHATSPHASAYPSFTPDQWKALELLVKEKTNVVSDKLSGKINKNVILDTGASHHMTGNVSLLKNVCSTSPCSIGFADGSKTISTSMGVFHVSNHITLEDVLYVPSLDCTLISVSKLLKHSNCVGIFTDNFCVFQDRSSRTLIGTGEERDGAYYLKDEAVVRVSKVALQCDTTLWHQRLGHPSFSMLSTLPMFSGVKNLTSPSPCDICFKAKQTREVFHDSFNKAIDCFSLIHVDVWGPYRTYASCGAVYFLTIVDDFSRAVWTYLLLEKSEVKQVLQNFCAYTEKQFGKHVRTVRSDNGSEFMCMSSFFRSNGIVHQTSCVATPQQNGRVERIHRHILNIARSLLFQASLPVKFWGEAVSTAAYLINRTPSKVLKGKIPYEILFGEKPSYDQLRVFGSSCYTHRQSRDKDKFGHRSRFCVFVGYPFGKKGWKVYDLEKEEFLVSRDVVFQENVFPFAEKSNPVENPPMASCFDSDWIVNSPSLPIVRGSESNKDQETIEIEPHINESSSPVVVEEEEHVSPINSAYTDDEDTTSLEEEKDQAPISQSNEEEELGVGKRVRRPYVRLQGYVTYNANRLEEPHHDSPDFDSASSILVQGKTPYPLTNYISDDQFSPAHQVFLAAVVAGVEPTSHKQAMNDPRWTNAMGSEVDALEVNRTWDIVDLPPCKVAINNKWVYKIKFNFDGTVERYKARLVACGNRQVEGEDYNETFAPVVKMSTVRSLLRIVAGRNWEAHQMDVHNAFLHGDLEEKVYMKLPVGFQHSDPTKVCRLRKSLYGLKQPSRCWFAKLTDALTKFSFEQSYGDYSLFTYSRNGVEMRVLIYVDDLLICGNNSRMLQSFKDYLGRCFHMKDLGKAKYFLGIEIARNPEGIFLSQRKYALDIIREVGLLGSKPASTPLEQNHKLGLSTSDFLTNPQQY